MKRSTVVLSTVACSALAGCVLLLAQGPVVNIDPHRHANLAAAQSSIVQAYQAIDRAQADNNEHLGGHAAKAKQLLMDADAELRAAATTANHR
ncbi:MAG TPA: hypothetical protein VGN16_08265 [Acidobacteriaceae bacterium]|jgi:hypothetical protein